MVKNAPGRVKRGPPKDNRLKRNKPKKDKGKKVK